MFTGIIEEIGIMRQISRRGQAMILQIGAQKILEDVHIGDSIAVNGVCLTVVAFDRTSITVDVMPETYRRSTLRHLTAGSKVNLERAMAANGRFGGHIVQGHVDATGTIQARQADENAVVFRITPDDSAVLRYMIAKGSITIDGISLTLVNVTEADFSVSIIPHTLAETILQEKQPGDAVNLETDILGKYVEKLLGRQAANHAPDNNPRQTSRLTEAFLTENGFA